MSSSEQVVLVDGDLPTPGLHVATTPTNRIRITAAAQQYGVSTKTIRRRIADGTLTAYRFGPKLIVLDVHEIERAFRPITVTAEDSE